MLQNIKKNWILYIIPLLLVLVWFKDGLLIAKAEEGIPFYEPIRIYRIYRYLWFDYGFGFPNTFYLPRLGFFLFADFLKYIGLPTYLVQAIVYYVILLVPLLSIKNLVAELIKKSSEEVQILSAVFYLLNLYTMTQIFQRMVYPLLVQWSFMPLFILLWIRYLNSNKLTNLLLFLASSLVFSMAFGIPSGILVLWIPPIIYSLYKFIINKFSIRIVIKSLQGLSLFTLINLWWLYPQLKLASISFGKQISTKTNLNSLFEVNNFYNYTDILLLKQKYVFGEKYPWHDFYMQNSTLLLSIIVLAFVLIGLIKTRKKVGFVILLFFSSLFLVKASLPPFGEAFYSFIFGNFSFTQVLRNPYEKLGIIFLLAYSISFAVGVIAVVKQKYLRIAIYTVVFVYLVKPIWNGQLWIDAKVTVPDYYASANENMNSINGRILRLPFLNGPEVEYDWLYKGGAHAEQLYDAVILDKNFQIEGYDDFYPLIADYLEHPNFANIAYITNIGGVLTNKDLLTRRLYKNNYADSINLLNSNSLFEKISQNDSLGVYSIKSSSDYIYLANNIINKYDLAGAFEYFVSDEFSETDAVFVQSQNGNTYTLSNQDVPIFSIVKENASRYLVKIQNARERYILVLSQNYHPLWKAEINDEELIDHFEVNGYANGWIVDKKGDYTIDIKFAVWPWE